MYYRLVKLFLRDNELRVYCGLCYLVMFAILPGIAARTSHAHTLFLSTTVGMCAYFNRVSSHPRSHFHVSFPVSTPGTDS